MNAKNDSELATLIGTDRKSLRRWRERFEPHEIPQTRDVEQWRKFTEDNLLGPYSAQRAYGEGATAPKIATVPEPPPQEGTAWNRMQSVFPVMAAMHSAYLAGELHPASYLELGPITLSHVKAISELWGTDIAPDGWDVIWAHIEKEVAQKLAADDAVALAKERAPVDTQTLA